MQNTHQEIKILRIATAVQRIHYAPQITAKQLSICEEAVRKNLVLELAPFIPVHFSRDLDGTIVLTAEAGLFER